MKPVLNDKSIVYISGHSPELDPGVDRKVHGLVESAKKIGYTGVVYNKHCRTVRSRIILFKKVFDTDARYIFLRSFGWMHLVIMPYIIKARWQGRKIICDQPNSLSRYTRQLNHFNISPLKRTIYKALTYLHGSIGYLLFNRIIQYDIESSFFMFGVRHKAILMGNGIDADQIKLRTKNYTGNSELKLVGVASLKDVHGYDRIINAIAIFNQRNSLKAKFYIVGGNDGNPVLLKLKQLTEQLGLENYVTFYGTKGTDFINKLYGECDIAVDAISCTREGVSVCSSIKTREYAMAGIPFICSLSDPDFNHDEPFRIMIPNDESIEPIVDALEKFPTTRKLFTDEQIRRFALDNLSYEHKFKTMINGLL